MAKTIWTGLEDSGKSYMLGVVGVKIMYQNAKWLRQGCEPRPIVYNCPFSDKFLELCDSHGVPHRKWKDLEELPFLTGCDLFIDEVGTYFDSRTFKDLPLDIRLWLAQASKLGVDIYGAAQDFSQVDVAFRRLTTQLFYIHKLAGSARPHATRPPINRIWGICTSKEMDPVGYDENTKAFNNKSIIPWPFLIKKQYCDMFETGKRIEKSAPPPYKHIVRRCAVEGCGFELYKSINGHKHKITHV